MSSIMRPTGPEASETYWMRRALVVAAFLVLLIIILIFLFNLGGRPGQAAPDPASTPSSSTAATAAESSASTSASTGSTTKPSVEPSASATVSKKASTEPPATSQPSDTSKPSATSKSSSSSDPETEKSEKPDEPRTTSKPDESIEPRFAACDPDDLRATIKSDKHTVGVRDKVEFELSVINGSAHPCELTIGKKNYELKIYSGTDRIWSSNDCAKAGPEVQRIVQPEQQVEWTLTWNGRRSDDDAECKARPEIPRPGYYYATSQLRGGKPVQFLLILK